MQGKQSWIYRSSVDEMHEDYIRPQENGSHADCDYVKLTSKEQSVTVVSPHSFSFSVSPYTQEELTRKAHHLTGKERKHDCLPGLRPEWNRIKQLWTET